MQHTGMLIPSWPAVIGSDVSGIVLEAGADCKKIKEGDYIFTCVPVGISEFSPFQETFLVEEDWVFKKGDNMGLEEACTVGAGLLVSFGNAHLERGECEIADGLHRPLGSRFLTVRTWSFRPREARRRRRTPG
jgi:NADPH:quinone reductase-like Zn-dependent oxidoreductase